MIKVFHDKNPTFGFRVNGAGLPAPSSFPEGFTHVADVDVEDENFHEVFGLTNHIDQSWQDNPGVTPVGEATKGARSTSVGDVIVLSNGKALLCASMGWEPIPATS